MLRRCVMAWAWLTHDPSGPQVVNWWNSSPSRAMARRAGHLRPFFGRVIIHRTRTHSPSRFGGRSGVMSSTTSTPGVFRRSASENTSLASRTSTTPRGDAGTFAQAQHAPILVRDKGLVVWWPFGCLSLLSGSGIDRYTPRTQPLSST